MKKLFNAVIALCVVLSLTVSAFASKTYEVEVNNQAVASDGTVVEAKIETIPAPTPEATKEFATEAVQTLTTTEAKAFEDAGLDVAKDLGTAKMPLAVSLDISVEAIPEGGATFSAATGAKDGAAFFVVHLGVNGVETTLAFSVGGQISFKLTNFSPVYIYAAPALDKAPEAAGTTGGATAPAAGNGASAGTGVISATPTAPKTGDMTMLYAGVVIMLASAAAVVVYKKKA